MNNVMLRAITGTVLFSLLVIFLFCLPPFYFAILLMVILAEILLFEWPVLSKSLPWWGLVTALYLLLPFACLLQLTYYSSWLLFLLFTSVALFDTAAYAVGKMIGVHKIAPQISPGKSWEGFFGGFLAVWLALVYFGSNNSGLPVLFLLALVISTLGLMGDLAESCLKRRVGVKDSGSLLPGHGGLLDRIDGLLPVSIFFCVAKSYLNTLFGS